MNLKSTGEFIAKCRKDKGLTQEKLANQLFVSQKTISKWECGKGFPDSEMILPLCQQLGISANELLSGQKLSDKSYKEQAEKNILSLKIEQEKSAKLLLTLEIFIGVMATIFFMLCVFSAGFFVENFVWQISLIVIGFVSLFVAVVLCLYIELKVGFYECECCHHKYVPKFSAFFWSMHIGRTRYLKCPKCKKWSWNKKTTNFN